MAEPTLADLLRAYERTLVAKVQIEEFTSWGGTTLNLLRQNIDEHALMERAYVEAMVRRRRGSADA